MFRAGGQPASLEQALALWREERLDEAEVVLRDILLDAPEHPEANNLVGAIFLRRGLAASAEPFIRKSIHSRERYAAAHNNLGNVFLDRNELEKAADCYRMALACDAHYAEALTNLGGVLNTLGEYSEAEAYCRRAVDADPGYAGAYCNLGSALLSIGKGGEAIAAYRQSLRLAPEMPEALINLSLVLQDPGYLVGVVQYYEERLKRSPGDYQSHLRIAQALQAQDKWDDGRERLMMALDIRPEAPDALLLFGHNHAHAGDAWAAIECYRQVLMQQPNAAAHSGLVFNLMYCDGLSGESLLQEFMNWAERYAPPQRNSRVESSFDLADRPLRIGYVSKDFALHSVAYFLDPILAHHDPERVFAVCYSTQLQPDAMTERFRQLAHLWRDVSLMSVDELESTVVKDEIDILVDLSGHTSGHRLELFARRPAKIQVTYLGHPASTGLSTMDYRIGDQMTDPPGMTECHYTERLWRLPGCFLTYRPPEGAIEIALPPSQENGYITFGSFNNALKLNDAVLALWAKILLALPGSKLVLKSFAFSTRPGRNRVEGSLARLGINPDRIRLMGWLPTGGDHLAIYRDVDIGLDPFPYNGTTTTCEALWMGVPVICLEGDRHSGRVGASLLATTGLSEFLADTPDDYVRIALNLATNPGRLAELRGQLRSRMISSALLDHRGFTSALEQAYRSMWQQRGQLRDKRDVIFRAEIRLPFGPGLSTFVPDSLEVITRYVLEEQGDWFEDEIEFVRKCLTSGQTALDIGANYGTYALSMAQVLGPQGAVWAFEPSSSVASLLKKSAQANGFGRLAVVERAVSSQVGTVRFLENRNSELSRVLSDDGQSTGVGIVSATTLDHCQREFDWPAVDFIKIDAEGQEPEVVLGGRTLLTTDSPLVMAEFKHGDRVNTTLIETIAAFGYRPYRLVPGLMLLVGHSDDTLADPYLLNLFFCKPDRAASLALQGYLIPDDPADVIEPAGRYEDVLELHRRAMDSSKPTADRWKALSDAREGMELLLAGAVSPPLEHSLTFARLQADCGLRDSAREEFERLVKLLETERKPIAEGSPFLASSVDFEGVECKGNITTWALASSCHWLTRRLAYSSYFAPERVLTYLRILYRTGYCGNDVEQRIALILRRRFGDGFVVRNWKKSLGSKEPQLPCRCHASK